MVRRLAQGDAEQQGVIWIRPSDTYIQHFIARSTGSLTFYLANSEVLWFIDPRFGYLRVTKNRSFMHTHLT
jgi:hypothetical protein